MGLVTQSQRLAQITAGAKEIRLAYQSGAITHEERMERLHALTARPSLWSRIKSLFCKGDAS
tara:strand:+ start:509 stop:694 length:186 start_codon:yes stop_codon:yes gene_type:complete